MVRLLAALLIACQGVPYSAALLCHAHQAAGPGCEDAIAAPNSAGHHGAQHSHAPAPTSHGPACPLTQICANGAVISLPAFGTITASTERSGDLIPAALRQAHPADAAAPPFHPPKA